MKSYTFLFGRHVTLQKGCVNLIYDFKEQLKIGEAFERKIDDYYSKFYIIEKVGMDLQRKGIDRIYKKQDKEIKVEYKADSQTAKTNNFFIETWSVENVKRGWVYTTESDYIFYLAIGLGLYIVETIKLRNHISYVEFIYRKAYCNNKDYRSEGILIPIQDIERIMHKKNTNIK
jgi:hypothetical protein